MAARLPSQPKSFRRAGPCGATRIAVAAVGLLALAPAAAMSQTGPAGAPASAFPAPDRPVAGIISPHWGDAADRDRAAEVDQIVARLHLKPGEHIADIGAGDGYDSLKLAKVVGPHGRVLAEDITAPYLNILKDKARAAGAVNVIPVLGEPHDPRLAPHSLDAAIMVHMYHEIAQPYALLYNLAPAFKPGARLGVEERNAPTNVHGTPPALLACEFKAVGYREVSVAPMEGGIGYFAIFQPPTPAARPAPGAIKPCHA